MYNLSIEGLIWRFYLMMIVVIVPFLVGHGIFALIALPVFLSGMFGMRFHKPKKEDFEHLTETGKSVSAVGE